MKIRLAILIVFLTITISPNFALAQEPSLWLGGMQMQIGMSQKKVMSHLSKYYDLNEVFTPNSYIILEKKSNDKGDNKIIGQVTFDNGKLTYAVKNWQEAYSADIGAADRLFDALHAILRQMEEKGEVLATISTKTIREPDTVIKMIKISFGKRWITISSNEHKGSKSVQISETIRYAPFQNN